VGAIPPFKRKTHAKPQKVSGKRWRLSCEMGVPNSPSNEALTKDVEEIRRKGAREKDFVGEVTWADQVPWFLS